MLHAGAVGIAAGVLGAAFFAALELGQRVLLGGLAGFEPLRARGETFLGAGPELVLEPAILALVLVAELAGSYDLLVPMMLAIGIDLPAPVLVTRGAVAVRRRPAR